MSVENFNMTYENICYNLLLFEVASVNGEICGKKRT